MFDCLTTLPHGLRDKPCVFLAGLYSAERGIADRLLQLGNGKLPWPWIDPDKAIPWIEQRTGLVFAESQRSAVALGLTQVLVITGGPGVGKTTLVNAILRILSASVESSIISFGGVRPGRAVPRAPLL